jgi:uncharacterized membrane protein YtjA (UPF0391 family)
MPNLPLPSQTDLWQLLVPLRHKSIPLLLIAFSVALSIFGFGGIAASLADIATILFFVLIVLFLINAIAGAFRGRPSA